jgi:penicillin G amidase
MKKIFFSFLAVFAVAICFPQEQVQEVTIESLKEKVTIRRDNRWIPYIEASNEDDLYFAQGYIMASDRLWQMDLLRRVAKGETAEIFGKTMLEQDKYWRRFGFSQVVEKSYEILDPKLKKALENYSRGVNAYIRSLDEKSLPTEFRLLQYKPKEWKPTDTMIIGKILAEALSTTWKIDLLYANLQKSLPKEKFADVANIVTKYDVVLFGKDTENAQKPEEKAKQIETHQVSSAVLELANRELMIRKESLQMIGFYAEDSAASNNWVISGKRTLDGKPILANDPHLPPTAPGIWYLVHLSTPEMRVAGVTFPGVPGVILGHNEFIAWGATNVGPDVQDLYLEEFNAEGKYKTPNGWEAPIIRREEIKYRPNPLSPQTESQIFEFVETRNGVVILEEQGKKYALRWTALNPENQEFETFYYLNRAKNWEDFKAALKKYGGPMQNFVYADVKGNIGWYAAGRVPIRRVGYGQEPYIGYETSGDWVGFIPFDELPHLYNPPEGFIVTANQRIVGTSYKYQQISREIAPPWRARRIYELLKANTKVTINDVRDIQYDIFNIPLSKLARAIVQLSSASEETLTLLRGWDGKMAWDSKAAVVINQIKNCIADKIADDNKPLPSQVIREKLLSWIIEEKPARWLPKNFKTYDDLMKTCDAEAKSSLSKLLGEDQNNWIWGNFYVANFTHPLAAVKSPFGVNPFEVKFKNVSGSGQTPNVGAFVSMRFIASPGAWDETRQVIPLGQSGHPQSPYWKDQFEAWRTGIPQVFPFSKEAVLKTTKQTLVLQPKNQNSLSAKKRTL